MVVKIVDLVKEIKNGYIRSTCSLIFEKLFNKFVCEANTCFNSK